MKVIDAENGKTCQGTQKTVELLLASAVPSKVSRHQSSRLVAAGATEMHTTECVEEEARAVGGGAGWAPVDGFGIGISESNTGIINTLFAEFDHWTAVGTNDEAIGMNLEVYVICLNP